MVPPWIIDIVTSEFLWGIVVGLVIALIGANAQARFQFQKMVEQQQRDMRLFSQDIIRNIMRVSNDIEEARRRSRLIHPDLLALIDVEVGVFGRNREHSIRLNDELRGEVRKYITDCALRRADIGMSLAAFDREMQLSRDLQAAGNNVQADAVAARASNGPLTEAHKAMDELIATAKTGQAIIDKL